MMLAAPAQLVWVDEITRHEGAKVNCSLPVVTVLSVVTVNGLVSLEPVKSMLPA